MLGSLIIDPEAIAQVEDVVRPDDFYRDAHKTLYQVMLTLWERHEPADLVTLCNELERLSKLAGDQPTITQASLPSPPSTSRVAMPKSVAGPKQGDDMRPLVLAAIGIAGATAITGIVLVRRGRVPLG